MEEEEEEEEDMIACDEADRPVKKVLITPFLSRVQLAGTLRAKPKPVGTQATGLVQVGVKLLLFRHNAFFLLLRPAFFLGVSEGSHLSRSSLGKAS